MSEPEIDLRGTEQRLSPVRRTIARRMVSSLQESAQLTTVVEADVSAVLAERARLRDDAAAAGIKLTVFAFLAAAAVRALQSNPVINAVLSEDGRSVRYYDHEHLAIAVDTARGLMAPVIRDAGQMGVVGLAAAISDMATRARTGDLRDTDLVDGTFTISNTGSRGALFDTPILNQPQVAILGTGVVRERPVVVRADDGARVIATADMIYLSLSYDHRLVDGADAARYLQSVTALLAVPRDLDSDRLSVDAASLT